jgi:hypothetical protein
MTDRVLVKAIERARTRFDACAKSWAPGGQDEEVLDAAAEATDHARVALAHLDGGRWDEADAAALLCLELEEEFGSGRVWRDFALLVEEAAAVGRSG